MTHTEWMMLVLAIYFHDMGMIVTRQEYDNRNCTDFIAYKQDIEKEDQMTEYLSSLGDNKDLFLYQEFVRENHATRIKHWIDGSSDVKLGNGELVREEVSKLLANFYSKFKRDLAMICESHHLDDIDDFGKYKVSVMYGNNNQEKVNLNYIAIILRIADLLHITNDRTPSISRRLINVSNPVFIRFIENREFGGPRHLNWDGYKNASKAL